MYKYLIAITLILSGCANFSFNAVICENIASNPNARMPEECRDYDEKKADKAFNKVVDDKKILDSDLEVNQK